MDGGHPREHLGRDGIGNHKEQLPWTDVTAIQRSADGRRLEIRQQAGCWHQVDLAHIPNLPAFTWLVESLVPR